MLDIREVQVKIKLKHYITPSKIAVQLTLEEHGFELWRFTYMPILFNKCVLQYCIIYGWLNLWMWNQRYRRPSIKLYMDFFFFWCGPFLKSLLNLLQYCFCLMFWPFGHEACGILASQLGIEPAPLPSIPPTPGPTPEDEVLTTRLPGKSLYVDFWLQGIQHP